MFEAATEKFCKSVGEDTLLPAPSIDESSKCSPFQIIVKKNHHWYSWQSPSYKTCIFSLKDLILEDSDVKVSMSNRELLTYNKTHHLSVNGKLGLNIKSLLEFELDGCDAVAVEAKFGKINKCEVNERELMNYLADKHINLKNQFVSQVAKNRMCVLCVVVGQCVLADAGSVTAHSSIKAQEKISEDKLVVVDISEEGDVDREDSKSIQLPKGTCIAYSVRELRVAADGRVSLCLTDSVSGRLPAHKDCVDGATAHPDETLAPDCPADIENLAPLTGLPFEERERLRVAVLRMCGLPADIDACLMMLRQAWKLLTDPAGSGIAVSKTSSVSILAPRFLSPLDIWTTVLSFAKFNINDESVDYPVSGDEPQLSAMLQLYQALVELSDEALTALSDVTATQARHLSHLLRHWLQGETLPSSDPQLGDLFSSCPSGDVRGDSSAAARLVAELSFRVAEGHVVAPEGVVAQRAVHGAVRALYALYWEPEEQHQPRSCLLL